MKKLTKGKGLLGMVLTALLLCALVVPATSVLAQEEVIDQHYGESGMGTCYNIAFCSPVGQEFTPTLDNLTRVEIHGNTYEDGSTVTLNVRESTTSGPILTTATQYLEMNVGYDWMGNPYPESTWYSFDVPDISLVPGSLYVIEVVLVEGEQLSWCSDNGNPYPGGRAISGGIIQEDRDWFFRTYGMLPPAVSVDLRATGDGPTDIINVTGYSVPFGDVTEDGITVDKQTAMGALVCYCQDNTINVEVIDTGWGPYVSQIGGNPADANTWMYALNESFPWIPADQQSVVNGDSLHWCNYTLGLYSLSLSLDKTEIAPGDDITATVTWTDGEGVTEPSVGAEVYVSDTTDTYGNPVPPGTSVGSTSASGELTFVWSTEGRFWPYAEFDGKSSIGQWPVPTFTCRITYGESVFDSWKTWRPERALGEPDSIGARIKHRGGWVIIQLSNTITDATKVTVRAAKGRGRSEFNGSFDVYVSEDGKNFGDVGSVHHISRGYSTYEFTGNFGNVNFIKVERWKYEVGKLYLDAVCASNIPL